MPPTRDALCTQRRRGGEKADLANGEPRKAGGRGGGRMVLTPHDTDFEAKHMTRGTGGHFVTIRGSARQEDKTSSRGCAPDNSFRRRDAGPGVWRDEANPRRQLGIFTSLSQDGYREDVQLLTGNWEPAEPEKAEPRGPRCQQRPPSRNRRPLLRGLRGLSTGAQAGRRSWTAGPGPWRLARTTAGGCPHGTGVTVPPLC